MRTVAMLLGPVGAFGLLALVAAGIVLWVETMRLIGA
jgi:hypothetical protein